jgi:hypothetical protein
MADTIAKGCDARDCAGGCKRPATDEISLGIDIPACEECAERTMTDLRFLRERLGRYPTRELVAAILTDSDRHLTSPRLQALERARLLVQWAVEVADRLGDPTIPDPEVERLFPFVDKQWAGWSFKGVAPLEQMQVVACLLRLATVVFRKEQTVEAAVSEAVQAFRGLFPAATRISSATTQLRAAIERSAARPYGGDVAASWESFAAFLDAAQIGNGWHADGGTNPDTLRKEFDRYLKTFPALAAAIKVSVAD